jgi:hypothetical protein
MPDKKQCCALHCSNSRVTFEDAVIVEFMQEHRNSLKQPPGYYFGFYCQNCRDEDARMYGRLKEDGELDRLTGPLIVLGDMARLLIEEEQFPSHAQERLAMMRLTPETFYHPDVGMKGKGTMMVYCKPPVLDLGGEDGDSK